MQNKIFDRIAVKAHSWIRACSAGLIALLLILVQPSSFAATPNEADGQGLKPILNYISTAWDTLTRSMTDCQSIVDPKIATQSVLYLPKDSAEPASPRLLRTIATCEWIICLWSSII